MLWGRSQNKGKVITPGVKGSNSGCVSNGLFHSFSSNKHQLFIVLYPCSRVKFQRNHLHDPTYTSHLSLGYWPWHGGEALSTVLVVCTHQKRGALSKQNQNADKQRKGKWTMIQQKHTQEPFLCGSVVH